MSLVRLYKRQSKQNCVQYISQIKYGIGKLRIAQCTSKIYLRLGYTCTVVDYIADRCAPKGLSQTTEPAFKHHIIIVIMIWDNNCLAMLTGIGFLIGDCNLKLWPLQQLCKKCVFHYSTCVIFARLILC